MLNTLRRELGALAWIIRTATVVALVAAIVREMRLPPDQRSWRGRLLGFVPYDLRPPTPQRLVQAFWNPRSDEVLGAQPFGVGWAVNLPALARWAGSLRGDGTSTARRSGGPRPRTSAARKAG